MADTNFAKVRRIEDKYIVTRAQAELIEDRVKKHLNPMYPDPKAKFQYTKTTYIDSDNLVFYRAHLDHKDHRVKLRLRRYAPNGRWDISEVFLEIKEKDEGEVFKQRIQLDKTNYLNLHKGKPLQLSAELLKLNKKLNTPAVTKEFVTRVNKFLMAYDAKPVVSVFYKRHAYQKGNIRVTIDTDIIWKSEGFLSTMDAMNLIKKLDWDEAKKYGEKYNAKKNAVLEIKYDNDTPEWIDDLLKDFKLEPTKFSKYVWGLYWLLKKLLLY